MALAGGMKFADVSAELKLKLGVFAPAVLEK
jgi:hypothetical protein